MQGAGRTYREAAQSIAALRDLTLDIAYNESLAVTGPSGSGKTTLLHLIAGLDRPTSGTVTVLGQRLEDASEGTLTRFRAKRVGIVFQDPHLLPGLSALNNIVIAGLPYASRKLLESEARELLEAVGLGARMDASPTRLSGGERQRVGIARALLGGRPILVADEPTGNLDAATTEEILSLIDRLRLQRELTVVLATHDPAVASFADRVVRLIDGRLDGEHRPNRPGPLEVHELDS